MLSLQHNECLAHFHIDYSAHSRRCSELGLVLERCPIRDFDPEDMRRQLPQAVRLLAHLLADEHRVYVHCTAGIGRSALVVLGYFTFVVGQSPEAAIGMIHERRNCVSPNWEAYHGCREDLARSHKERIAERAYGYSQSPFHKDVATDWNRAEVEVLREALTERNGDSTPGL